MFGSSSTGHVKMRGGKTKGGRLIPAQRLGRMGTWLGMDGATSDTIEETKPFHASMPTINHLNTKGSNIAGTQQSQVIRVGEMESLIELTTRQGTARQGTLSLGARQSRASTSVRGGSQTRARTTTNKVARTQKGGFQRASLGARQTRSTTSVRSGIQLRATTTPQFIPPRMKSQRILHNKVSTSVKGTGSSKDNDIVLE
ncbi:hypothetical protein Tco_0849932 [Tanacetum coccineum]